MFEEIFNFKNFNLKLFKIQKLQSEIIKKINKITTTIIIARLKICTKL